MAGYFISGFYCTSFKSIKASYRIHTSSLFSPQLEELWHVVCECEDDDGGDVAPRGPLVAHVVEGLEEAIV